MSYEEERTVTHVPSEMTETVKGVESGGKGDDSLCGNLGPSGKFGEEHDEGGRVEGNADGGKDEVSDEEGVHSCLKG